MIKANIKKMEEQQENKKLQEMIKNLCINNLAYLLKINYQDEITKILKGYVKKGIGEKRAEEISKKIGKKILEKDGVGFYYYETLGRYERQIRDENNNILSYEETKEKNIFHISTKKRESTYYGNYVDIEIEYKRNHICTISFEITEDDIIPSQYSFDKLRYNELEYIDYIAIQLIETYNNAITKIRELKKEIQKTKDIINCDYMRQITNRCLYIYDDYRDQVIEI